MINIMNGPNPIIQAMAQSLGLKINSPQAAAKVDAIAETYGQQAAAQQQVANADATQKAVVQRKQGVFQRRPVL